MAIARGQNHEGQAVARGLARGAQGREGMVRRIKGMVSPGRSETLQRLSGGVW